MLEHFSISVEMKLLFMHLVDVPPTMEHCNVELWNCVQCAFVIIFQITKQKNKIQWCIFGMDSCSFILYATCYMLYALILQELKRDTRETVSAKILVAGFHCWILHKFSFVILFHSTFRSKWLNNMSEDERLQLQSGRFFFNAIIWKYVVKLKLPKRWKNSRTL